MSTRTIKDPTFNIYKKGGNVENKNRPIGKEQLMQLAKDEADILLDMWFNEDITKIAKLGWQPKISLKEGIQSTVEYYKENIENNLSLRL